MKLKKLLCMALAMLMALSAAALAETDDLQAQLDAANARVAELEALVALYQPYYEQQIVATFGDDGIIWRDDAMEQYEAAASAYAQYGMSIDAYADEIKADILESLVQEAVLDAQAEALGISALDDETRASLEAEAAQTYESYIESYKSYFAGEDATDEEAREQTIAAMEQYGMTLEAITEQSVHGYIHEQLHSAVTEGTDVTDEEVKAKYDAMVAEDQQTFADDRSYNTARNNDETIAWNPEGYRAVKHVLIKFDDEQAKQYSELHSTLDSLNAELEALDAPAETEAPEAAETTEAEAPAETAEPRTREQIQSDIGAVATEIEALYSQLLPQAQQVIDEFNGGADFDSLIEKYNADPGMTREPTASNGYAVAAGSTTWDPAFTEGAMSIEAVGGISAPVYGQNGIHVIYYLSDITPGPVPFEDIADAVKTAALSDKIEQVYNDQVAAWVEEAAPVYYTDRF